MSYKFLGYKTQNVKSAYTVVGIVYMHNGCCKDEPVLITANAMDDDRINYSCQCGCGMWCTTGHPTPVGALKDYETMSNNNVPLNGNY